MVAIQNNNNSLFRVVIFFWLALTVLPVANVYSFFVVNLFAMIFLYYYLISSSSINFVINKVVALLPIYFIPFLNNCISFGGHQPIYMFLYGVLQNLLLPLITLVLVKNRDAKNASFMLIVVFLFLLITSVTTYVGNELIPGVSRQLAGIWGSNPEQGRLYKGMNIGGFDFVYTITLVLIILSGLIRNSTSTMQRIFFVFSSVIFVGAIIKSEYGLALAFSVLAGLTLLIKNWSVKKIALLFLVGFFGVYVAGGWIISLIGRFADTTESVIYAERFGDVASLFSGEYVSDRSDVSIRQSLYIGSWKVFLEHPIAGDPHNMMIGGHSFFMDALANYGFIGLILLLLSIRTLFINFIKPWRMSKLFFYFIVVLLLQVLLLFMNTMWFFQVFYVIIPLLGFLSLEHNSKHTLFSFNYKRHIYGY